MSLLEISETENVGERRWGVSLIDDNGVPVLRNITQLPKGVALSTAKTLKHKGPAAPFVGTGSVIPDTPAWVAEKVNDGWLVRFTLVSETLFDPLIKAEDGTGNEKIVENALTIVKSNLAKAELRWHPPEADPAYQEKESDLTPTVGHPGS